MDPELYTQVSANIKHSLKIDIANYKTEQMKRRLDAWLVRTHMANWEDYFRILSSDLTELERFRNYLTINVTEFFRDPQRWNTLQESVLPYLVKNAKENFNATNLKLWSAGCSTGAEAYTLAIMMADAFPFQKYSLLATDLDRGALLKAKSRGPYTQDDIRNLSNDQRKKYVLPITPHFMSERLSKNIRFEEHDLLADKFENDFDLIVCRNVVIYFTAEAKETLYQKFSAALRPGGVLFLGGTEIISGSAKFGLQNFGISFYRKM